MNANKEPQATGDMPEIEIKDKIKTGYYENTKPLFNIWYDFGLRGIKPSSDETIVEIYEYIKNILPTKNDMEKSKNEIISSQKELISDLINELNKRSFANILAIISIIGLATSLTFLLISIFQRVIQFTSFHFILSSITFSLILIMSLLSRNKTK
jgi:hypothetical protein